jgi:hypothetical protein
MNNCFIFSCDQNNFKYPLLSLSKAMLKSALFNCSSLITLSGIAFIGFSFEISFFEFDSPFLISFGSGFVATPFGFGGLATI